MMASFTAQDSDLHGEPTLEELLADPMVLLMMKRDGVKPQTMRREVDRLQRELLLVQAIA